MNQVATIVGDGTIGSTLLIVLLVIACSIHDRATASRWRLERLRAEHYAACDEYAARVRLPSRTRGPVH